MFCMKCGTELPDDALFCFKCGASTSSPSRERVNHGSVPQPGQMNSTTNRDVESTSQLEIKGITGKLNRDFEGMAEKLSKGYVDSLRKRYGSSSDSLELFIKKSPADVEQLFTTVDEYIVEFLKGQGIYHVPVSSVRTATRNYLSYWPAFYEEARSVYQGIQTDQQQMKRYRDLRKASRGRVIGGGFGLKGAVKGIAAAGAVNMTTGMVHSIANAAGNASSAKDAAFRKEVYYKSADFKDTLQWCIQEDCRSMLEAVSELWSNYATGMPPIPYYSENDREQAYAIAQALMDGQVPEDRKADSILKMLSLYPVDVVLYHCAESAMPSLKERIRADAALFGIDPAPLEKQINEKVEKYARRLVNCASFDKLKNLASYSLEETVARLYHERANEMSPQFSLVPKELRDVNPLAKEIKAMRKNFADFSGQETPILVAGVGEFNAGSDGLLMTNEAIYLGRYIYALADIDEIEPRIDPNGAKNIVFNGKAAKNGGVFSEDKENEKTYLPVKCNRDIFPYFIDTITFLTYYITYLQACKGELKSGNFLEDLSQWLPEGEVEKQEEEKKVFEPSEKEDSSNNEDELNERLIYIKKLCENFVVEYCDQLFQQSDKLLFNLGINKDQIPLLCHDDTIMGSGKRGFVITDQGVHCLLSKDLKYFTSFSDLAKMKDDFKIDGPVIASKEREKALVAYSGEGIFDPTIEDIQSLLIKLHRILSVPLTQLDKSWHEDPTVSHFDNRFFTESPSLRTQKIDEIVSQILAVAFSNIQRDAAFNKIDGSRVFAACGSICPPMLRNGIQKILASIPSFNPEKV